MAEQKESIVLDVKVDIKQAIEQISVYNNEIEILKKRNKELRQDYASNAKAIANNEAKIQSMSSKKRELTSIMQAERKQLVAQEGSLNQLSAQLSKLTKEYNALSAEQRNSASGKAMLDQLNATRDALAKAKAEMGDYRMNVGNYENSIKSALGVNEGFVGQLVTLAQSGGGAKAMFTSLTSSVASFGKALLALLANPIVAIIAGIVAVFMALKKAIDSNEESMMRFQKLMAPVTVVLDLLMGVLQKLANYILEVVQGWADMVMWLSRLAESLPFVGKYIKEFNDEIDTQVKLTERKLDLDKQARDNEIANAKAELEVSKLRTQAKDKEKYSVEERLAMIERAGALEEQMARRNMELAKARLQQLEEENRLTDNKKEVNDEIAKAEAEVYRAEKAYYDKTRELQEQKNSFLNEQLALIKQIESAEKELYKMLLELRVEGMDEGLDQDIARINLRYDAELEALREKYADEALLTEQSRSYINEIITLKEQERQQALNEAWTNYWDTQIAQAEQEMLAFQKAEIVAEENEDTNKKVREATLKGTQTVISAMTSLFEAFGEDSATFNKLAKTMALVQIGIDTAKGIAGVTASAATEPTMVLRIANFAQGIAMVMTNIARAKQILASEGGGSNSTTITPTISQLSQPTITIGDAVRGAVGGSSTADALAGVDTVGVATANAMAYSNEQMNGALETAVANIRPVVAVEDINTVQNKVDVIDTNSRL